MIAVSALVVSSCNKEMHENDQLQQTIRLSVDVPITKATIFDTPASLNNSDVGGGDFAIYARMTGDTSNDGEMYMSNVRVNYFRDANDWRFANADGIFVDYFWPLIEKLDFFGHFPLDPAKGAVTKVTYTKGAGPSFNFALPLNSAGQEGLHEFLYSFVQDKGLEEGNPAVEMGFSHPYAAVSFNLGQSYRMTLHDITLTDICYKGLYEFNHESKKWELSLESDKESLVLGIGKDIPSSINFNSPIGGPYLVAPQELSTDSKLRVSFTRLDKQEDIIEKSLNELGITKWEAGKHYVYTLNMGNTEEEILFKVQVDEWESIPYKNVIEVQ